MLECSVSAVCVDHEGCSWTGSALVVLALQALDDLALVSMQASNRSCHTR